jgi:phosphatidylserine/phosphatidylglycerophosphate/cardiolipin synthase-like enzyme
MNVSPFITPAEDQMAKFLTTHGIGYHIEQVIQDAKRELTLITPYLQLSSVLLDRLKDADRRAIRIRVVYGKNELKPEEHAKLAELENLALFYLENLHAKCYANEEHAVVGSMNMYQFSEKTNREMGVLLTRSEDADAFADAQREMQSILAAAEERKPRPNGRPLRPPARVADARERPRGACIRCADGIAYRPEAPFCNSCYRIWAEWGNEEFPENYCHRCGKPRDTTMARPLCYGCFREDPFTARAGSGSIFP